MSLIQEALQKAGKLPADPPAPKFLNPETPRKFVETESLNFEILDWALKARKKISASHFAVLSLTVLGFVCLFFVFNLAKPVPSVRVLAIKRRAVSKAAAPKELLSLIPSLAALPKLTLSGITSSGNDRIALINNQVLRIGDTIGSNGFVKDIQDEAVVLDFHGHEVVLNLNT